MKGMKQKQERILLDGVADSRSSLLLTSFHVDIFRTITDNGTLEVGSADR